MATRNPRLHRLPRNQLMKQPNLVRPQKSASTPSYPQSPQNLRNLPSTAESMRRALTVTSPHLPLAVLINPSPKVHSMKDLQKASFKMYDAVPSSDSLASSATPMAIDPEIEKFLPMLQDYLKINEIDTSIAVPPAKKPETDEPVKTQGKDEDYVWDVFLSRPAHAQDINRLAANIGTVTGLPEDGIYASDSDSEEDDEDDEDSNAEDWYTNDYPDEESSDEASGGSDAFHDDSDYEDVMYDDRFNRIAA
ncbi:hypothetical protein EIP86_010629 [Pleurotus ostreatoroseus]|nr:hypothetical protein EIP86_010629 [Pleurotus ostreatoroseus]